MRGVGTRVSKALVMQVTGSRLVADWYNEDNEDNEDNDCVKCAPVPHKLSIDEARHLRGVLVQVLGIPRRRPCDDGGPLLLGAETGSGRLIGRLMGSVLGDSEAGRAYRPARRNR